MADDPVQEALDDGRRLNWRKALMTDHGLSAIEADRLVSYLTWLERHPAVWWQDTQPGAEERDDG